MSFGQRAVEMANNLADAYHGPWRRESPTRRARMHKIRDAFIKMMHKRILTREDEAPWQFVEWMDLVVMTLQHRGVPVPDMDRESMAKVVTQVRGAHRRKIDGSIDIQGMA